MPDEKKPTRAEVVEAAIKARIDAVEDDVSGLVKMFKEGVESFVHPTCVEAHKAVGWIEAHF